MHRQSHNECIHHDWGQSILWKCAASWTNWLPMISGAWTFTWHHCIGNYLSMLYTLTSKSSGISPSSGSPSQSWMRDSNGGPSSRDPPSDNLRNTSSWNKKPEWNHDFKTLSSLLVLCEGNPHWLPSQHIFLEQEGKTEWSHDMEALSSLLALCEGNPDWLPSQYILLIKEGKTGWHHNMETLSALLALCEGNLLVTVATHLPETKIHIDGLVQERRNSIAYALELRLPCTNPSMSSSMLQYKDHLSRFIQAPL